MGSKLDGFGRRLKINDFTTCFTIYPKPSFGHNKVYTLSNGITLIACYHTSQQNTLTGRLTPAMFNEVFKLAKSISQQN